MIFYFFNQTDETIYATFADQIRLNDMRNFYSEIVKLYSSISCIRILQDERKATFPETELMIQNSKEIVRILTNNFSRLKIAVIQNRPVETAYSYLFGDQFPELKIDFKIFSSEENAVAWLRN